MSAKASVESVKMRVVNAELFYIRRDVTNVVDWNYEVIATSAFLVEMPHSSIGGFFDNEWFNIELVWIDGKEAVRFTLKKGYAWDGCSVAPDIKGALEASVVHDAVYQFCELLAKQWGWEKKRVLSLGDTIFNLLMQYYGVNSVMRTIYYKAVCWVGYSFHSANTWLHKFL